MAEQNRPQPIVPLKQRWSKPLRVHLSFIIVALLVAISVPLLWLTYSQGRTSALDAAKEQMELLSQQTIGLYETIFRDGLAVVTIASVIPALAAEPPASLDAKKNVLLRALQGSRHLDGVYLGYPSGAFVQLINVDRNARWRKAVSAPQDTAYAMRTVLAEEGGGRRSTWVFLDDTGLVLDERPYEETTYDPRRRPWYRATVGKDKPVWLGPYVSASTNSLTFTLATTMDTNRSIVVGADVLLESLSRMLAEQAISEHATGYVFDDDGRLAVHSDPAVMTVIAEGFSALPRLAIPVFDADPIFPEIAALVAGGSETPHSLDEFRVNGVPYIAHVSRLDMSSDTPERGTLVIAAPLDDFTGASVRLLNHTLAIAAGLVMVGVVLSLWIARAISRALIELSADARRFGDLDFDGQHKSFSWITEINMLSVALNSARDAVRTFALYVPRELVRKIVAAGQAQAGQAVRQDVTVLFTDIKDFTTISERLSPEEVVDMLGVYFQRMNVIVERHGGVIVQYLGDSIYAMWNAPVELPAHVEAGCRCTLDLKAAIDDLNAARRESGLPEFITRFGLHTGIAVVGSVGAAERRQYTAMGDTVNVASRLEGMNKEFLTTILVSAAVRDACHQMFQFNALGNAHAKGRVAGIEVFELVGEHSKPQLPS